MTCHTYNFPMKLASGQCSSTMNIVTDEKHGLLNAMLFHKLVNGFVNMRKVFKSEHDIWKKFERITTITTSQSYPTNSLRSERPISSFRRMTFAQNIESVCIVWIASRSFAAFVDVVFRY
jgi:hypothetical protein